eukprot:Skav215616  [mRNA]  locus=scaffold666:612090:612380:- [translate_table: standard]
MAEGKPQGMSGGDRPEAPKSLLPAPPKETPRILSNDSARHTQRSADTSNFDGIKLCLPNKVRTFVASLVVSLFSFLGLLFFGFAEVGLPNGDPNLG